MVSTDFEVVIYQSSPERQPPTRRTSMPVSTGTLYVEAQAESDYDGSLDAVRSLTASLRLLLSSI